MTTLGESTCIVKADANTINELLEELWPENPDHILNFLTWLPRDSTGAVRTTFAQNLSSLLGARISQFETTKTGREAFRDLLDEVKLSRSDLVIFCAQNQSIFNRLVGGWSENKMTEVLPVSSMLVHGFRWPIKKILLILRNDESDETALNWTLSLAKPCRAFVTVLPITVPVPVLYADIQPDIPTLMTTECPLGQRMRWISHRLADWEIEGTLRLRNEAPNEQIHCEAIEGDHDVIVIAAEPQNRLRRWILGDLIAPLLNWADRPLLIAKPRKCLKEVQ